MAISPLSVATDGLQPVPIATLSVATAGYQSSSAPTIYVNGVGIVQTILLGNSELNLLTSTISAGIQQSIALSESTVGLSASPASVGILEEVLVGRPNINADGSPLSVSSAQAAALRSLSLLLHDAFADGIENTDSEHVADRIKVFVNLSALQQEQVENIFNEAAAAFTRALNIPGELPTTSNDSSVTLAKLTTTPGSTGSLTFVDGILTVKVDPT